MKRTLASLVLAALVLSGCSGKKGKDHLRVSFFSEISAIEIFRDRLEAFEKENNATVDVNFVPFNSYNEKLVTQLAGGSAPDIINVEVGNVVGLRANGALVDLSPYIKKDGVNLEDYYQPLVNRMSHDGKLYGMPVDTAPVACLYYNKTMFDEAGLSYPNDKWTWNDLIEAGKKLRKGDGKSLTTTYAFKDNYGPDLTSAIFSNGGSLVDDTEKPTRCLMNEPAAIEAIQTWIDMVYKYKISPNENSKTEMMSMGQDMFINRRVAMTHTGLWIVPALKVIKDFEWDIAPFPRGPRATQPGWNTGGSAYSISRDSKNPDLAWKLVKYLTSIEAQTFFARRGIAQPAVIKLATSDVFLKSDPPLNRAFLHDAVKYARYVPAIKEWTEIETAIIAPRLSELFRTNGNVKKVMDEVVILVNAKLDMINGK